MDVLMTFSERERFIYHATTLMTMSNLGRLTKTSLNKKLETMRNNRCKNLLDKQIEEVLLDLAKEVETLLSPVSRFGTKQKKCQEVHKQKYKKNEFSKTIKEYWK